MYAIKKQIVIPASRHLELDLPAETPEGPAEITVQPSPKGASATARSPLDPVFAAIGPEAWDELDEALTQARRTDRLRRDDGF